MDPLYLRKLRIDRQINNQLKHSAEQLNSQNVQKSSIPENTQPQPTIQTQSEQVLKDIRNDLLNPKQMKMNYLASMERSDYVKRIMNLPKTLPELLIQLQNPDFAKVVHINNFDTVPKPFEVNPEQNKQPQQQANERQNLANNNEFNNTLLNEAEKKEAILKHYNAAQTVLENQSDITKQIKDNLQNPEKQNMQLTGKVEIEDLSQINRPEKPLPPPVDRQGRPLPPPVDKHGRPLPPPIDKHGRPLPPPESSHIHEKDIIAPKINNNINLNDITINNRIAEDIQRRIINHPHDRHHHIHKKHLDNIQKQPVEATTTTDETANLYANLAMNDVNNPTLTQMRQRLTDDAFELLFSGMINLNDLSKTIKNAGKDARGKLILAMANAAKQGIDNSQLNGTMHLLTESVAESQNSPSAILKNIITLYLPWYPLQEGVGFNLAIETMPNESAYSSLLKIFIQTKNYGNVSGSLVLMNQNNVDMNIHCNEDFPKKELLERMEEVTQNNSIQSNITVEQTAQMKSEIKNQETKVNLSSTYELNPFLLLMAHSFIKNTIIIDSSENA